MIIKKMVLAAIGSAVALSSTTPAIAQDYYMGQVLNVGFSFCPTNTLEAAGQILAIQSNSALYSLLGVTYGGNGSTTFGLPDLRGRTPLGQGQGPGLQPYQQGQLAGTEQTTLIVTQLPAHTHPATLNASTGGPAETAPAGSALATFPTGTPVYTTTPAPNVAMAPGSVNVGPMGNNQPVGIRDPYLTMRYCIVTQGIFPSRP